MPEVHLELTKSRRHADLRFLEVVAAGPQLDNCTRGGLLAGISAALLPTLAYDIPWNEGLYHAIEVTCPEGLICNARKPAAVSGNISGAVWEVEIAATVALSRLVVLFGRISARSASVTVRTAGFAGVFRHNQHGERFMGRTYDVLALGRRRPTRTTTASRRKGTTTSNAR